MLLNPTPYSHIQLIVPESYLWGGAYDDTAGSTMAGIFDGDVDTWKILSSDSTWKYQTANGLSQWLLLYQHYGSNTEENYIFINGTGGGANELEFDDFAEEHLAQSANMWSLSPPASKIYLANAGKNHYTNLLVEYTTEAVLTQYHTLSMSASTGAYLRQAMFSRDYRVPMYDKTWEVSYSFNPQIGSNKVGIQSPRFSLASSYSMVGKHTFKWSDLTAGEKLTFELFQRAFGGNMARPFAMCIIHGASPSGVTNKVMTTHMLLIDDQKIRWSVNPETNRHAVEFSATELIRV